MNKRFCRFKKICCLGACVFAWVGIAASGVADDITAQRLSTAGGEGSGGGYILLGGIEPWGVVTAPNSYSALAEARLETGFFYAFAPPYPERPAAADPIWLQISALGSQPPVHGRYHAMNHELIFKEQSWL